MKKSITIVLFLLICSGISAQKSPGIAEKSIKFNIGYQNRVLLDEQKSALIYSSDEFIAGLSFLRDGEKSIVSISLDAGMGSFDPRYIKGRWLFITSYDIHGNTSIDSFPVTSQIITGKLEADYLKKFNTGGKTLWLAGASVKELLIYPDNYTGLLNSLGLHAKLGIVQKMGDWGRVKGDFSFPVLAVNSRLRWHNTATSPLEPEIATFFRKGSRLVSFDKFRMLELNLDYEYNLARHWRIGAAWSFTWLSIPYYQPMKSYMNTVIVKTVFIF